MSFFFDSDSNDIRFIAISKKKILSIGEREQGLDHSERKVKNGHKMSNTCSIELKIPSLNLVLDQDSYEISFISIGEKKFFGRKFF